MLRIGALAARSAAARHCVRRTSGAAANPSSQVGAAANASPSFNQAAPASTRSWTTFAGLGFAFSPNLLCNIGNGFAVAALGQSDMLTLRGCMVGASACGIAFNLLQPKPLYTPAAWGLFFVTGHLVMIYYILRERQPVAFDTNDLNAYEETFQKHGFTPRQFKRLVDAATWHLHEPGSVICAEGAPLDHTYYVSRGSAEILAGDDTRLGEVGKSTRLIGTLCATSKTTAAAGNTGAPTANAPTTTSPPPSSAEASDPEEGPSSSWPMTVRTTARSLVLTWPREELDKLLAADKALQACATNVSIVDLRGKLMAQNKEMRRTASRRHELTALETYRGMLSMAAADSRIDGSEKRALREYRKQHGISDAQHATLLSGLGWSAQEFHDGVRFCPREQYRAMVTASLADGIIDGAEKRTLRLYREAQGITSETHEKILCGLGWSPQEYDDGARHDDKCHSLPEFLRVHHDMHEARYKGVTGAMRKIVDRMQGQGA